MRSETYLTRMGAFAPPPSSLSVQETSPGWIRMPRSFLAMACTRGRHFSVLLWSLGLRGRFLPQILSVLRKRKWNLERKFEFLTQWPSPSLCRTPSPPYPSPSWPCGTCSSAVSWCCQSTAPGTAVHWARGEQQEQETVVLLKTF